MPLRSHHSLRHHYERTPSGRRGVGLGDYLQVELWRVPAQPLLNGSLATLPLASIAHRGRQRLSQVIDRLIQRLRSPEVDNNQACDLAAITTMIMGLRSRDEPEYRTQIQKISRMFNFAESEAIDIIAGPLIARAREEGEARGEAQGRMEVVRTLLVDLGTSRFGPPDHELIRQIQSCEATDLLQQIASQMMTFKDWEAIRQRLSED